MYPTTVALIDDDSEYAEYLAQFLSQQGMKVEVFRDSRDLLAATEAYAYDFYLVDLMLPGIDGVELIKVLRKRSNVGVLVVSGRLAPDVFKQVVDAGADMYLAKPVHFAQVSAAIAAVQRRAGSLGERPEWRLDRRQHQLVAPDGVRIDLTAGEMTIFECFLAANGGVVSREELRRGLGREDEERSTGDALTAMIFRLRRRIERATPALVPLQSKSRVGYEFRAPLKAF